MITPATLKLIYRICLYAGLIGIITYVALKMNRIMKERGTPNLDDNIVQDNNPSILQLDRKQLSKSLTVRYLSLLTVSGFLSVFGFMGLQTLANHIKMRPSFVIAVLLGFTGLVICALVEYAVDLMVKHDVVFAANTVGLEALVYKDVKSKRRDMGKVRLDVNGHVIEFDAVTNEDMTLRKGSKVRIRNSLSDTCVVVE